MNFTDIKTMTCIGDTVSIDGEDFQVVTSLSAGIDAVQFHRGRDYCIEEPTMRQVPLEKYTYALVEYTAAKYERDNPAVVEPTHEEVLAQWKIDRSEEVSSIVVTYNGVEFQGDEDSQNRLSRSINGMMNTTETIDWIALDNTSVSCNKEDLQNILRLAGLAQATIWNVGRPIEGEVNG